MSKLSKFDIWIAISAIWINVRKIFFRKKKHHNVVLHVPSFQLSARSSSFFLTFFLHFHGTLFYCSPYIFHISFVADGHINTAIICAFIIISSHIDEEWLSYIVTVWLVFVYCRKLTNWRLNWFALCTCFWSR